MRLIPPDQALIPTTIEQAINPNRQVIFNTNVIEPGQEFFLMDFDYIHYDDFGNRTNKTASTNFLLNGNCCVITLPGAHVTSIFDNTDLYLQSLVDNLANLKMEFGKIVLVTKDPADDLYEWVMQAVHQAPWYDAQRHNKPGILQELGITLVSDKSCQLINALGLATVAVDQENLGITSKKSLIEINNGVVKRIKYENDASAGEIKKLEDIASIKTTPRSGRVIADEFALIPATIEQAIEPRRKAIHNKKVIDVSDLLFSLPFEYVYYDQAGNRSIKASSTDFLSTGNHCIITLPGAYTTSTLAHADPHLQDYIENIHHLNSKFDKIVIIAKGHAGNLHELVMQAIKNAKWYDPKLHDQTDILQQLKIVIVPDNNVKLINALGLAVDGHKRGIVSKRGLIVAVNGAAAAVQYENDPLVSDRVHSGVAMQVIDSLQLPAKKPAILYGGHPTQKLTIVGGGIVGAMEAYFAYLEARKNKRQVRVTIYDKNPGVKQTTAANISPSLTADEMLSVVLRGKALAEALSIPFNQPGGINVSDQINKTPVARNFIAQVEIYREYEEEHKSRTNALLQLGKFSMDLWRQVYDEADADLKRIFDESNFNPCREPLNAESELHDGYRIDLIYNVPEARSKAENMRSDYVGIGYKNCRILSPEETQAMDPSLLDFCAANSEQDSSGAMVWKKDAVALYRPGGCLNAQQFLPKFYEYLQRVMGQYTNEYGIVKDCFRIKYLRDVNGVVYGSGLKADDNDTIIGLKFKNDTNSRSATKFNKYQYEESDYVFAPGENVGLLTQLGLMEPAYAAFAGASLILRIPIPADQLELYTDFNHCMEVNQVGIVLAWQAKRIGDEIFIGVAGTKSFYGDTKPHKDEEFAKDRNLLQLNMINDVLPQFISMAMQKDTTGQKLTAQDLQDLEDQKIAHRWVGNRGVIYDGVPVFGFAYKQDGKRLDNAAVTAYLGSGGVSNALGGVSVSRGARGKDSMFAVPDVESMREIDAYTSANRKIP